MQWFSLQILSSPPLILPYICFSKTKHDQEVGCVVNRLENYCLARFHFSHQYLTLMLNSWVQQSLNKCGQVQRNLERRLCPSHLWKIFFSFIQTLPLQSKWLCSTFHKVFLWSHCSFFNKYHLSIYFAPGPVLSAQQKCSTWTHMHTCI